MGDDRTALQAVVAADVELMELREEEAALTAKLQSITLDDKVWVVVVVGGGGGWRWVVVVHGCMVYNCHTQLPHTTATHNCNTCMMVQERTSKHTHPNTHTHIHIPTHTHI